MLLTLILSPVTYDAETVETMPAEREMDEGWALFGVSKMGNLSRLLGIFDDYERAAEAVEDLYCGSVKLPEHSSYPVRFRNPLLDVIAHEMQPIH